MKATVVAIGKEAFSDKVPMVILFGETATEELKKYSVVQKLEKEETFYIKKGDCLKIDDSVYTINYVGDVANDNLNSIAHVTLIFSEVPDTDRLANGLYLSPHILPPFKLNTQIEYLSLGV